MIRVDTIRITKKKNSKQDLSKLKDSILENLRTIKPHVDSVAWYEQEKEETKVFLKKPIAFEKILGIFNAFQLEGDIIEELNWKVNEERPIKIGTINVIVS